MIKKTYFFLPFILITLFSTPVFAVESTIQNTTKPQEIRKETKQNLNTQIKEIRQEKKEIRQEVKTQIVNNKETFKKIATKSAIKDLKVEQKLKQSDLKKKQFTAIFEKTKQVLTLRFNKINSDKVYLENRIKERKAKGFDTSLAENKLATFSTVAYNSDMANLTNIATSLISSEKPFSQDSQYKETQKKVNNDLLLMRKTLTETIKLLVSTKTSVGSTSVVR